MKIAVRYHTRLGNTKKLADAIASIAGVKAETLEVKLDQDVEILFLGSSVYAAGVDQKVKDFIMKLNPNLKKVVCFSTAAILKSTYSQVSKLLSERNIKVDKREFHCRGSFTVMHKGHPNREDIAEVEKFTKDILKNNVM
ncbi:MAG: flavodoxin family protein [Mobilitalea sp.]